MSFTDASIAQSFNQPLTGEQRPHRLIATCWMHEGPTEPFIGRMWSPWSLRSRVAELARVGFTGIGLFHEDLAHVLEYEAQGSTRSDRLAWVKSLLDDQGLVDVELEFLTNWMHPADDLRRRAEQPARDLLLEAAGILQARHVKVGNLGTPASIDQLRATFAELCADAQNAGTVIAMEVLPPDPNSQTLAAALEWVRGPENGGLFLDTWHVNNMPGVSYGDIASLAPGELIGVELDDGLAFDEEDGVAFSKIGAPGFIEMTCNTRRIPGEGDYDVIGFIQAVRAAGFDGPWGNEILSEEYRRLPMEVAYRRVHKATSRHLQAALHGTAL